MKRKLLFTIVALLCTIGTQKVNAAAADYLTGWTEMTSMPTSNSEWSKYYYVFVATEADLMLAQETGTGKDGDAQENKLTTVYRTPGDPAIDKKFVWMIDYDGTYLFGIRNLNNSTHYMQSRESAPWRVQFAWETAQSKWTMWDLVYADSKWSIQNKLAAGDGGGDNNWLGPWTKDAFADNMVTAGNAGGNGNAKGTFKIYRILCKDYQSNVTSSYLTNADFSGDYEAVTATPTNVSSDRKIYRPNGWAIAMTNKSQWNMTVVKNGDPQQSGSFTGTYAPGDGGKYMVRFRDNNKDEYIDLSQTISVAAGIYTFSADLIREDGSKVTVELYAGDSKVANSSGGTWQNRSFTATLAAGEVKVGVKFSNLGSDGKKVGADNVKMMYKASDKATLLTTIENAIQLNNALNDGTLATAIKTALGIYRDVTADQSTVDDGNTALSTALSDAYSLLTDGRDLTGAITNAAVTSTTGWTNGRINSGQQFTGAPDNTYMDTWNDSRDQKQTVNLPAGYYMLKVATRAIAGLGTGNVYAYANGGNLGSANIHKEGNAGNLLGNGWAWTRFGFYVSEPTSVDIGFYSECGSSKWAGADDFHLYYYTTELAMKQAHLAEVVADANAWAGKIVTTPALEVALAASAPSCSTVEEYNTAISNLTAIISEARAAEAPYAEFNRIKACANSIKDVEYTESVDGAYTTFTAAIPTQTTAADNATTAATVNTALDALRSAVKTYIANAEPKNEGEFFEITGLIANPSFEYNNKTGWSGDTPGFESYNNAEFFNKNFDFYQNITGLANGSYQLSVQAFCRPGDNGNNTSGAYYDYTQGISNITSELYVNSDASTIGNIYSYKDNTTSAKVDGNDFHCNITPDDYWVPNNMQGAGLYFADNAYVTEVAALVEDGNLKIGFREKSKKTNQWVIFDNFRLYFYGSSKFVYYKQYLPQLKAEVAADLANAAYDNVTGKERGDLTTANAATPVSETEAAYKDVIDDIKANQTAFKDAKSSYDALVAAKAAAALTKISANIGEGVFQYNATTNNTLYSAYETCKAAVDDYTVTVSSTSSIVQALVDALDDAIEDYNNQALNAPDAGKRYWLTIVDDGKAWDGNAITYIAGARADQGLYGVKYFAPANKNLAQALKLTHTTGNKYKVSVAKADGTEQYLTTAKLGYNTGANEQIRTTDDVSKALEIEIKATATDGQFQLYNTAASKLIANNDNNDVYTANSANFTVAEAEAAAITINTTAAGWGTVILPFAVAALPDGVKAYSVSELKADQKELNLVEVNALEANKPYIIEGAWNETVDGDAQGTALTYTDGLLTGVYKTTEAPIDSYVLQMPDLEDKNSVGFYQVEAGTIPNVPANRAYLTTGAGVKAFFFNGGDADGIKSVFDGIAAGKIYDLSGRKVVKMQKGNTYIVNGKKVNVK